MIERLKPGFKAEVLAQRKFSDSLAKDTSAHNKVVVRIFTKTGPHYEKFTPDDIAAMEAWASKFEPAE